MATLEHITTAEESYAFKLRGKLFLIVGPAGAGKHTLFERIKKIIGKDEEYHFPRRVIQKAKTAEDVEDFEDVTKMAFISMVSKGEFVFHWTSHHGSEHGIRLQDVQQALDNKKKVVFLASRQVVKEAKEKFGDSYSVHVVEITAEPEILKTRLHEKSIKAEDIKQKLKRNEALEKEVAANAVNHVLIRNNSTVSSGASKLLQAVLFQGASADEPEIVVAPKVVEHKEEKKVAAMEAVEEPSQIHINEDAVLEEPKINHQDLLQQTLNELLVADETLLEQIKSKASASDSEHVATKKQTVAAPRPASTIPLPTPAHVPIVANKKVAVVKEQPVINKIIKWALAIGGASVVGFFVAKKFGLIKKSEK
ncbi:bifunctional ribose bisphosphokinase-thymidine phosphorylase [Acrasis kona]|uniref:Bifunctional ribose bisphosphokinase-thymidine phosphorylase n=1 Tax=Acrasis kona TaxID=1008807 RepID=A0AAW2YI52_9EUKA